VIPNRQTSLHEFLVQVRATDKDKSDHSPTVSVYLCRPYGILNHCDYAIHNGKIEGVNNKIKVIKRKAYGFHDLRYFTLKIYQAFYN